jgi:hypothetical protein
MSRSMFLTQMTKGYRPPPPKINNSAASDGYGSQTLTPKLLGRSSSDATQPALRLQHDDSAAANAPDSSAMLTSFAELNDSVSSTLTALSVLIAGHDGNDLTPSLLPRKKSNSFVDDAMDESFGSILSKVSAMLTDTSILGQSDDESQGGDDRSHSSTNLLDVSNHSFTPSADGSEDEALPPAQVAAVNPYAKSTRKHTMPSSSSVGVVNCNVLEMLVVNENAKIRLARCKEQLKCYAWTQDPNADDLCFTESSPEIKAAQRYPTSELLIGFLMNQLATGHSYSVTFNEKVYCVKSMCIQNPLWTIESSSLVLTARANMKVWKQEKQTLIDNDEIDDKEEIELLHKQVYGSRTPIGTIASAEAIARVIAKECHPLVALQVLTTLALFVTTGRRGACVRSHIMQAVYVQEFDDTWLMQIPGSRLKTDFAKHPTTLDIVNFTERGVSNAARAYGLKSTFLNPLKLVALSCKKTKVSAFPALTNQHALKNKSKPSMIIPGATTPIIALTHEQFADKIELAQRILGVPAEDRAHPHGFRAGQFASLCLQDPTNNNDNFASAARLHWKGIRTHIRYENASSGTITNDLGEHGQHLRTESSNQLFGGADLTPESDDALKAKSTLQKSTSDEYFNQSRKDVLRFQSERGESRVTHDDLVSLSRYSVNYKRREFECLSKLKDANRKKLFRPSVIASVAADQPQVDSKKELKKQAKRWSEFDVLRNENASILLKTANAELFPPDSAQVVIALTEDSDDSSEAMEVYDLLNRSTAAGPREGIVRGQKSHHDLIAKEPVLFAMAKFMRQWNTDHGDFDHSHRYHLPNKTRYRWSDRSSSSFFVQTAQLWRAAGVDMTKVGNASEFMRLLFKSVFDAASRGGPVRFFEIVNDPEFVDEFQGWNNDAEIARDTKLKKDYVRMRDVFKEVSLKARVADVAANRTRKSTPSKSTAFLDSEVKTLMAMKKNGESWKRIGEEITTHSLYSLQSKFQSFNGAKKPRGPSEIWTVEQLECLLNLRRIDAAWEDIAFAVGRSKESCTEKFRRHMASVKDHKQTQAARNREGRKQ